MTLRLAPGLQLPPEAVTETFALLAVRGAGKTNAARVMAEEMFGAKLPFVAVDPVGSWYGLRAGRDGGPGLPIPIFGGRRGDVPLERGAGQLLADLVVDQRLSCVLDLSGFDSEASKKAFLLDFARRLYARNEEPLHLFLEEADDYIPQRPMRDEAHLLRAWENIVRRGRARGLGITLITQRSASVNKSVLTQTGTLIAMRTTSPQDRAAVEDWLRYHAQAREVLESLPGLEAGEAWVWSPQFLKLTTRIRFRVSRTLDSGATPKAGGGGKAPATMADVDLAAIQKRMAATIERAKAEDPKELRKRIAELERFIASATTAHVVRAPKEVPVLREAEIKRLEAAVERESRTAAHLVDSARAEWERALNAQQVTLGTLREIGGALAQLNQLQPRGGAVHARPPATAARPPSSAAAPGRGAGPSQLAPRPGPPSGLEAGQQRILDTIGMLNVRLLPVTREAVARWMGIHPKGGRYNRALAALRAAGYLEGFVATPRGVAAARALATGPDAVLEALLDGSQRHVMRELLSGTAFTREGLAARLGVHPKGGRYNRTLAWLRAMGVIPERGEIRATEGVFR